MFAQPQQQQPQQQPQRVIEKDVSNDSSLSYINAMVTIIACLLLIIENFKKFYCI